MLINESIALFKKGCPNCDGRLSFMQEDRTQEKPPEKLKEVSGRELFLRDIYLWQTWLCCENCPYKVLINTVEKGSYRYQA